MRIVLIVSLLLSLLTITSFTLGVMFEKTNEERVQKEVNQLINLDRILGGLDK